ncbi:MAG: hypothetical protein COY66_04815 [Candidatus Kerfeldbacteria bacterium CG_4_10_14_0_8_um_filter_42_10]|uniref:Uncharacterized protein n=1 Tax=Candidatus Kerfeldbacteria bacterium CG_4_10_14_0_8_um_filter_42_10 TaxID=2014248 RepID=A0A2M7RHW7_9BACT|nr:MAG: hypothetical protein COY66_04815 [Candidatus Kerfeldbacteria bacterium CG_4_10_14_0_8_um_filter_42_10]
MKAKLLTITEQKLKLKDATLLLVITLSSIYLIFGFASFGLAYNKTGLLSFYQNSYFVNNRSNKCIDSNTGGTINRPWCTIQYAVSANSLAQPGDTIYIRTGIYYESVNLEKSGTAEAPIKLSTFKNEPVLISGSQIITNFTSLGNSVYSVTSPVNRPVGLAVDNSYIEEVWPFPSSNVAGYLDENQWTYDASANLIYFKISNTQYHFISVPQKNYGISSNNQRYWTIENISIAHFQEYGIKTADTSPCANNYLTVRNTAIGLNQVAGTFVAGCPGVTMEKNLILKNGITRKQGNLRHQGINAGTGDDWNQYAGNIYRSTKGTECSYLSHGYCNGGPELMYLDGQQLVYNYEAESNPSLLTENEWTTGGDQDGYVYLYVPSGMNLGDHQIKRAVFREDSTGHGIIINTPNGREGQFVINGNQIRNNDGKGISICYSEGACQNSVTGSVVTKNYIYNSFESGFDNSGAWGVTFSYNQLVNNGLRDLEDDEDWGGDKGLQLGGQPGWRVHHNIVQGSGNTDFSMGSSDSRIFHNTIVKDQSPLDRVNFSNYGGYASFLKPNQATDLKIKNNIFVVNGNGNHNSGSSSLYGIISCDLNGGDCGGNADWNGNDYYTIETNKRKTIRIGSNDLCLTPDQGTSCLDYNIQEEYPNEHRTDGTFDSLAVDPLFVDQANYNLQLQAGSALVNKGVPLTYTAGGNRSNAITVQDAKYFHNVDNYPGLPYREKVKINSQTCTIIGVDYESNTLTCKENINYSNGDKVYWDYNGLKPDIGFWESNY